MKENTSNACKTPNFLGDLGGSTETECRLFVYEITATCIFSATAEVQTNLYRTYGTPACA